MENDRKKETERSVVNYTSKPNTITSLKQDFKALGIKPGDIIIMHSSLSKIGWTVGGSVAVVKALTDILTPEGTLVMPTFTSGNSEPSYWENPPVPESWWATIREEMPAYNPQITPTRAMGRIVETFRTWPEVVRSSHPISSFAAWGKYAKVIIENHKLEADIGENSPISRLYDLNGLILLLGVSHLNNTSLHLAEFRCDYPGKTYKRTGCAIMVNNVRKWIEWTELEVDPDDFEQLGKDFESSNEFTLGKVGEAEAHLISLRAIVDFAIKWLPVNRKIP
ncbi:MAG: aminoglycoside N(3)-acetyltransferase [Candidatus Hermodarchaeota archaeon]